MLKTIELRKLILILFIVCLLFKRNASDPGCEWNISTDLEASSGQQSEQEPVASRAEDKQEFKQILSEK